jgi:hypothetical protein
MVELAGKPEVKFLVKKAMPLVSNRKHGFDFVFLRLWIGKLPLPNHE